MTQGLFFTLLALLLYGIWGFSYKLLAIKDIQGAWAVALVMLLGSAISAGIALTRMEPFPAGKFGGSLPLLVLVALSGAVGNIFLTKAMAAPGMNTGVVMALTGAYPLVVTLLAFLFLSEQLASAQLFGIAAIVLGVGLLTLK